MKIVLEWLKDYIKIDKDPKEIAQMFTELGLLLDKPIQTNDSGLTLLDLEHRMDRADWLAVTGCARDLGAFSNIQFNDVDLDARVHPQTSEEDHINIYVKDGGFVNRFYTRVIKGIKNGPSPDWLKDRLEAYGIPSINLIVDITNYVMVELGQPMHAHDIDKMKNPDITFRKAKKGERIQTLLGETVELDDGIYITTTADTPTSIGGIVGGTEVSIDADSTNILLEAGNYNQTIIRKSSRKLKIQNETVLRGDKFLHPYNTEKAVKRATQLLLELGGEKVTVFENADFFPEPQQWEPKKMTVRRERVALVSGETIDLDKMEAILLRLGYTVINSNGSALLVEIPYFRTDIDVEDDIVADIVRIHGLSKLTPEPFMAPAPKEITPPIYKFEERLRDVLVNLQLHEHITDPMVETTGKGGTTEIVLQNSINSEKQALRTSIYMSLKNIITNYKRHKKDKAELFEIGKVYTQVGQEKNALESYVETRVLQIACDYFDQDEYYTSLKVKEILSAFALNLGITLSVNPDNAIKVGGLVVGNISFDSIYIETEMLFKAYEAAAPTTRVVSELVNTSFVDVTLELEKDEKIASFIPHTTLANTDINILTLDEYLNEGKKYVTLRITGPDKTTCENIKLNIRRH